jgi:TRAP-type C4-dicarboxylate transport system permease small subunit
MLRTIERICRASARYLAVTGLSILMMFALATLIDGLLRGILHHPLDAVRDLSGVVVAFSVACCVPLGLIERSMITIQVIDPLVGPRVARLLDAVAAVATCVLIALIAIEIGFYAADLVRSGETTWMLRIPLAPFWWAVDAVLWWSFVTQLAVSALEAARAGGREWHPSTSEAGEAPEALPASETR